MRFGVPLSHVDWCKQMQAADEWSLLESEMACGPCGGKHAYPRLQEAIEYDCVSMHVQHLLYVICTLFAVALAVCS